MRLCKKNGIATHATDGNIIRRMRFACCITKATHIHNMLYLLLFDNNGGYTSPPSILRYTCIACLLNLSLGAFDEIGKAEKDSARGHCAFQHLTLFLASLSKQ